LMKLINCQTYGVDDFSQSKWGKGGSGGKRSLEVVVLAIAKPKLIRRIALWRTE